MENFNAIGQFREKDNHQIPIAIDVTLPNGNQATNSVTMQEVLLETKKEEFSKALVENLLTYSLGRELEFTDAKTVDRLSQAFIQDGYRLKPLIVRIVTDEAFRIK